MFRFGIRMILLAIGLCFFGLVLNWHEVALKTHTDTHMRAHTQTYRMKTDRTHSSWCRDVVECDVFPSHRRNSGHMSPFCHLSCFLSFPGRKREKQILLLSFVFSPGRFVRSAVAVLDTPVLSNITTHPLMISPPPRFCPTRGVAPTCNAAWRHAIISRAKYQ